MHRYQVLASSINQAITVSGITATFPDDVHMEKNLVSSVRNPYKTWEEGPTKGCSKGFHLPLTGKLAIAYMLFIELYRIFWYFHWGVSPST